MIIRKNNKKLYYLIFMILGINILITLIPNLGEDEAFTIGLIKHSFSQIINIDELDVHPPLYYLLLKAFLAITTFWTNSMIIKIVVARIFSLISFLILFYFLIKTLKLLKIHVNYLILTIFYLLFPNVSYFSTYIRMYQFSAMLIAIEVWGLALYTIKNNRTGLYLATISIILSLYTNYFAAMFAGLYLLIIALHNSKNSKFIKLLFAGIISVIAFLPCLKFCLTQIKYVSSNRYSNQIGFNKLTSLCQSIYMFIGNGGMSHLSLIVNLLLLIIEIEIFVNICKYSKNLQFKDIIVSLYTSFFVGFLLMSIYSMIKGTYLIQVRYGFPMFAIIYFFLLVYFINNFKNLKTVIYLIMGLLALALLAINVKATSLNSFKNFYSTDTPIIKQISKHNFHKDHYLYFNNTHNATGTINATFYSAYLPSTNKKNKIKINSLLPMDALGSNNASLMKKTYSNISTKYPVK